VDAYSCAEVFRRLDCYLDRELTPEEIERVDAHLAHCALCAAEARFERSFLNELRAKVRRLDVPPQLLSRILGSLEEPEPPADR
jgi:anti-sigma factor (TIGR02949 family)